MDCAELLNCENFHKTAENFRKRLQFAEEYGIIKMMGSKTPARKFLIGGCYYVSFRKGHAEQGS